MKPGKKTTRRRFLNRVLGIALGGASAAAGILAVLKGGKIDPFLPLDSTSVLKRFGTGRELLDGLKLTDFKQRYYATKIVRLKIPFDKNPSSFENKNFYRVLQEAFAKDFKQGKVILVKNWLLSETEVAVFIYNNIRKYRLIK